MAEETAQVTITIPSSTSTWLANLDKGFRVKTRTGIRIPRVQFNLRDKEFNKGCFDPVLVSLGPYHHREASLQCMEMYKITAVKRFANDDNLSESACDFYRQVESVALEAKDWYELSQPLSDDEFKKMIFLDSCFLFTFIDEYMRKMSDDETASNWLLREQDYEFVLRDMFLLENQIPFTVLNKLWSIKHGSEFTAKDSILYLFLRQHRNTICGCVSSTFKREPQSEPPVHLLDLFRKQIIGQDPQPPEEDHRSKEKTRPPEKDGLLQKLRKYVCCCCCGGGGGGELRSMPNSVTKMKYAGITCQGHPQAPEKDGYVCCCCILDISFQNGLLRLPHIVLRLPHIVIDDHTKCLFLNMITHEKNEAFSDIIYYIRFMSKLINKEEDVKELREHNVITNNCLASDKHVVDLFNGLSKDLPQHLYGYYDARKAMWDYNMRPWIRFRVWIVVYKEELYQKYFRSPWSSCALIAAIIGLGLTVVSTLFTIFPRGEGKP